MAKSIVDKNFMEVNDLLKHDQQFEKIEIIDPDDVIAKNILRQIL
jgi:hypothetical protein